MVGSAIIEHDHKSNQDHMIESSQPVECGNNKDKANECPEEKAKTDVSVQLDEHKLQTAWSIWYDKKMPKKTDIDTYESNLHRVCSFSTVEDFWRHYVHVKRPSDLPKDVNIYFFRDLPKCTPMWESFPNGGCWFLKIKKKAGVLGKMWQDLVFAAVGEAFESHDLVGISLAVRSKEDMISVWNADNSNENSRFSIGEKLKEILNLDSNTLVEYKFHSNSIQDMSTFRNAKPYVFAASSN